MKYNVVILRQKVTFFYKFNVNHVKSKRNLKDFIYRFVAYLTEIQYLAHLTFSIKFIHEVYEILSHALACSTFFDVASCFLAIQTISDVKKH